MANGQVVMVMNDIVGWGSGGVVRDGDQRLISAFLCRRLEPFRSSPEAQKREDF